MAATQKLLRFGTFELNLATEELRKNGIPLKLSPQPFRILALLASRAGQIVSREEIRQKVWGEETYVDFEHGMNQCIKQIRNVLGDSTENPVYVETLPRRGYRFLAPVNIKTIAAVPAVVEAQSGIHAIPASAPPPAPVSSGGPAAAPALAPEPISVPNNIAPPAPALVADAPLPTQVLEIAQRPNWLRVTLIAAVVVALVGGIIYWHSQRASALTEKDTVVLADFQNTTGDPVFDSALRQLLTFDLQDSRLINVLSDARVDEQLRFMGVPRDTRLTADLARQVCQRSGSKAMIVGSVSALGSHYLIGLEAIDCANGESLGHEQVEADSREHITKALNKAASSLRQRLGESLPSVQKNKPAEDATTPSLEALQAFNQARVAQITGNGDPVFYFKRTLELDPNLAAAYNALGALYENAGQVTLARQNYTKAYELRNRVSSAQERFYIEGHYYDAVTGELDKAIQIYRDWAQNYPANYQPHENLSVILGQLGQYESAGKEGMETLRLSPNNVLAFTNLVGNYIAQDRLDDAKATFEKAQALKLDYPYLHLYRYILAFLQDDNSAMQQQAVWAMGKPGAEDMLLSAQADTQAYRGRIESSRAYAQQATMLAKREGASETAATWEATAALREAETGDAARARQQAAEALALALGRNVQVIAAVALARAGDVVEAQKIAEELDKQYPHDTIMQGYSLPSIEAAIELAKNNPTKAIEILQQATPYELGGEAPGYLYPAYLRGEAYRMAGQDQQAVEEFQKILAHPGVMQNFVTGALTHLQLARAQAMAGNKDAARKSYQNFLALWKNADAGVPVHEAAKEEVQRLD